MDQHTKPQGHTKIRIFLSILLLSMACPSNLYADEFVTSDRGSRCLGGTYQLDGFTSDDVRLDYSGDAIHLVFGPTDSLNIHSFNPNDAYSGDDIFEFSGEVLCRRDLVMRGFDLEGTTNSEIITGTNATDRITAHAGNDTLNGGPGDDTYFYNLGDGLDCISDPDSHNAVVFGPGITANFMTTQIIQRNNKKVVQIRLRDPRRVRLEGVDIQLNANEVSPIAEFHFTNGMSLDLAELIRRKGNQPTSRPKRNDASTCIFDSKQAGRAGLINKRAQIVPPPSMPVAIPDPGPQTIIGVPGPKGPPMVNSDGNVVFPQERVP